MNFEEARYRYENDPGFRTLVDMIFSVAYKLQYTPGEVREAAMFAMLRVELLSVGRPVFPEANKKVEE